MSALFDILPLWAFCAALAVTFLGGFIKGIVGFALPLVMVSGLGAFLPPELALAGLLLPTLTSNLWQAFRHGLRPLIQSARAHWPFMAVGLTIMVISSQFVLSVPQWVLYLVIGVPVTIFAVVSLAGWQLRVSSDRRGLATWLFGSVAGVLGGIAAVWGPPTVAYLVSLDTEKREHIRVQGLIYSTGAIVLVGAHLKSGVLNAATIPFSAILIIPAFIGMFLGVAIQNKLDKAQFMRATLFVLLIAGMNLIRRALF